MKTKLTTPVGIKYELEVGYQTVYSCRTSKSEKQIIEELRNNFSHIINNEGVNYKIFKTLKSRMK